MKTKLTVKAAILAALITLLMGLIVGRAITPVKLPTVSKTPEAEQITIIETPVAAAPAPTKAPVSVTVPVTIPKPILADKELGAELEEPVKLPEIVLPTYSEEELEILAIIIYQEAGGDYCSDETRLMVGNVFLNRVASEYFPDTFEAVATAKGQYGELYWTGIKWPDRATNPGEAHAVARAYEIAERLLNGERVFDEDVIWQSEYIQGEIVVAQDGFYFCR